MLVGGCRCLLIHNVQMHSWLCMCTAHGLMSCVCQCVARFEHIALSVHSQVAAPSTVVHQLLVAFTHVTMQADTAIAASSHPAALLVR